MVFSVKRNKYSDLAYISAKYHLKVHRFEELKPSSILKLLKKCDSFRKPDRFMKFLEVCHADSKGKLKSDGDDYKKLTNIINEIAQIDNRSIIMDESRGHVIIQLIHNARLNVIKNILYNNRIGDLK